MELQAASGSHSSAAPKVRVIFLNQSLISFVLAPLHRIKAPDAVDIAQETDRPYLRVMNHHAMSDKGASDNLTPIMIAHDPHRARQRRNPRAAPRRSRLGGVRLPLRSNRSWPWACRVRSVAYPGRTLPASR